MTVKHTDSRYKAGLWFAAVRCLDCPAYSTWSVFHSRATPQVLTTTHMLTQTKFVSLLSGGEYFFIRIRI